MYQLTQFKSVLTSADYRTLRAREHNIQYLSSVFRYPGFWHVQLFVDTAELPVRSFKPESFANENVPSANSSSYRQLARVHRIC